MQTRALLASSFLAMAPGLLALHACSSDNLFPPLEDASTADAAANDAAFDGATDASNDSSPTSCSVPAAIFDDAAICPACSVECPPSAGFAECAGSHGTVTDAGIACDTPAICDCDGAAPMTAVTSFDAGGCSIPVLGNDPDPDSGQSSLWCPGCIVACPSGQRPTCTPGDPGPSNAKTCLHAALCACFH